MNFLSFLKVALTAISRNRLRAFLTILGILIGVGAVIAMMAIGNGAKAKLEAQLNSMGTNMLFIHPGAITAGGVRQWGAGQKFYPSDVKAVRQNCPAVAYAAPSIEKVETATTGHENWTTQIIGVDPDYFIIRNWNVAAGRLITHQDVSGGALVCLIGQTAMQNLFGSEDPIGKIVQIKDVPLRVVGILAKKGETPFGQDQDDCIMVPYTTLMRRIIGTPNIGGLMVSATSSKNIPEAEAEISALLRQRHHLAPWQPNDFMVISLNSFVQMKEAATSVIMLLLGSVAGISLLVGGIGIMNIMLVSVTERTREIGIRMAVGATEQDILMQFLIESLALSIAGGILGMILGSAAAIVISKVAGWNVVISPSSIILAFTFSAGIGIFFGYYPAMKASQLDPIEALRYQ
jgi:putative ABC transport system permease protein